jgi:16S rRNA (cytidine1402-2'-O)-methyltransferase
MPGILYVVATPIGNLEDVTLRALRVLREVAVIAAEDTRRTARLLQHYSISTRTTSLHEHNERARTPALVARLQAGESVALVSDAGTPLVSDPGRHLVGAAHAAGIRVEPVPGPTAAMAALSASGLPANEVLFVGFPPSRAKAREKWLERLAVEPRTIVLYEAPHRIRSTLADVSRLFGERPICVAREITKAHEELAVRPISAFVTDSVPEIGEFTVVIAPPEEGGGEVADDAVALLARPIFDELTKKVGLNRRAAVREVAKRLGLPPNRIYDLLLAPPGQSNDQ